MLELVGSLISSWYTWAVVAAFVLYRRLIVPIAKAHDAKIEARRALQFWEDDASAEDVIDTLEVHFPTMLAKHHSFSFGLESVRLYRVRRKADGTWEKKLIGDWVTADTLAGRRRLGLRADDYSRDDEIRPDIEKWQAFGGPTLEVSYQRFIHGQDLPIDDGVEARWWKEEAKSAARELPKESNRTEAEG